MKRLDVTIPTGIYSNIQQVLQKILTKSVGEMNLKKPHFYILIDIEMSPLFSIWFSAPPLTFESMDRNGNRV